MKMNIDKSIKKSLEGHELPYDPSAWESLSKKLDQTMPSGGSGSSSNWKWYLGGAAVVAVAVTASLFISNSDKQQTATINSVENQEINNSNPNKKTEQESSNTVESTSEINRAAGTENPNNQNQQITLNPDNQQIQQNPVNSNNVTQLPTKPQTPKQNQTPTPTVVEVPVILPDLDNMCKGDKVKIENKNDVTIYVIDASGNKTPIKAKNKIQFEANEDGKHTIALIKDGEIVKQNSFLVLDGPSVDMTYDNINIFNEGGLPTISMQTGSIGTAFEWKFESINKPAFGREVEAHFFKKGNYDVTLTVTGSNGCKASETMNVVYPEDYNLMAMMSFNPNSNKDVNRTFLPEALRIRNTPFQLMIFDPANAALIFETKDVSNPWTGIDSRNGQLVEYNKTYAWKVILLNPIEGERPEYAGAVVMSTNR